MGFTTTDLPKSVDVSLPLSQGQYEALINALREHWNWTPPEC
jgi:hypothetical protein